MSGDDYDAYLEARESGMSTAEALEEIGQPGQATVDRAVRVAAEQHA